jgi:transketolase
MTRLFLIPRNEFERVGLAPLPDFARLEIIADMARANALTAVKRAGSGHLGSSLSAMDLVVWLYFHEMNTRRVGWDSPARDIYFSSKGHDVPGLYAVLFALGVIPQERFLKLRRFGGLDGHPDVGVPGIEANSGSLGMGISKGKGMALAKRLRGDTSRVFVMTGDGEWQEGQNFEALQSAAQHQLANLIVIVDHNKVQSDKLVQEIIDLGDLTAKFRAFGWHVARCSGHDFMQLHDVFGAFAQITDRPKILIADTIKGRGISFMEHPYALAHAHGLYPWHAGAPDDASFARGHDELIQRINARLESFDAAPLLLEPVPTEEQSAHAPILLLGEPISQAAAAQIRGKVSEEYVAQAYGRALVELAQERADLVVLDADLASDCRIREFETTFPERFIENGIAEQDMVSTAGGLARQGWLPVVNSFASFLASRANEQIYNNATEQTKIIYAAHYAGLIPAGPGKSHQSVRDISLLGALPNMLIVQPCNADEARQLTRWCVNHAQENCAIRLNIGPSPRKIQLPDDYRVEMGRGIALTEGTDALLFAYGPVMLHEALTAAQLLAERGVGLRVVNLPWLNRVDVAWLAATIASFREFVVLEDHAPVGGLGDYLLRTLTQNQFLAAHRVLIWGVEGFPACGTPPEALRFHRLDGVSLAERILAEREVR